MIYSNQDTLYPRLSWWYIVLTLALSVVLNMIPWGRFPIVPDFIAIVITFWCVTAAPKPGFFVVFLLGILMDVNSETTLGLHALAYLCMYTMASLMYRRIMMFTVWAAAIYLLPVFGVTTLIIVGIQMLEGHHLNSPMILLSPIMNAVLWPIITILIKLPLTMKRDYRHTI